LRAAGVFPDILVPGVDEVFSAPDTAGRVCEIARVKGLAVRGTLGEIPSEATVLIAADTMLDIDGVSYGKPHDVDVARQRLRGMSNGAGVLYTGHYVAVAPAGGPWVDDVDFAATTVHFVAMTDNEIEAYLGTGEPLEVAGSFTMDGLGGPFVAGIEGDASNVIGLSLPLLRQMLQRLGVEWTSLWAGPNR